MTRTQYYTATTVDGFIADEHNSLDWLFEVPRNGGSGYDNFTEFFESVGAMAMGATTYEWVVDHEKLLEQPQKWHEWYGSTPCPGSSRTVSCLWSAMRRSASSRVT